ncbi:MAG: HEPN domain-containing protein [Candidatus Micrarchaeota archaeon]
MSLDELFREGHLKKIAPSRERAEKSIEVARRYLHEARKNLEIDISDLAVIASYSSVFHAARAILFVDGIAERSHFAIYAYLKEKHKDFGEGLINAFDVYRKLRHSVAYGLDTQVGKEDAKGIIEFADEFIGKVKDYLKL